MTYGSQEILLLSKKSGAKNKRLIKEITDSLDNILYIPEYVCLTTDDKRRFTKNRQEWL